MVVYDYIKNGLSMDDLKEIILKLNVKPFELVRKNEELYRKELKGKNFTDNEWLKICLLYTSRCV